MASKDEETPPPRGAPLPGEAWRFFDACRACGAKGQWWLDTVESVHPVSGDAYGTLRARCPDCGATRSWGYSEN